MRLELTSVLVAILAGCKSPQTDTGFECDPEEYTDSRTMTEEELSSHANDALSREECELLCNRVKKFGVVSCEVEGDSTKTLNCTYVEECPDSAGRGHVRIGSRPLLVGDPVGRWLRRSAHEEAAAALAFAWLGDELRAHGSPLALLAKVRTARTDEQRHAEVLASFCRDRGLAVPPVTCLPPKHRSLLELAIENAVEGCVRETWGAMEALHQAEHAGDARFRSAFAAIAADEIRHAELAWQLHYWLLERLNASGRREVGDAMASATNRLGIALQCSPCAALQVELGLPSAPTAQRLLNGLHDRVFGVH